MKKYLFVFLILTQLCFAASAVGYDPYDTEAVAGEAYDALLREVSDFSLAENPESHRMIKCFAISEEGKIALAFDGEYAQIDVYQADGTYLYGYTFENRNNAFSVFFEGENLTIYHVKGEFVASFDSEGNCVRIHRAMNTKNTSNAYHDDFYRPLSGQIGKLRYTAEKAGSMTKYARFLVTDEQGRETVIYAVSGESNLERILYLITGAGIAVGIWFGVKRYRLISQEDHKTQA